MGQSNFIYNSRNYERGNKNCNKWLIEVDSVDNFDNLNYLHAL